MPRSPKIVFFGTPQIAVHALEALESAGLMPALIVTAPDKKQGRGLRELPSPCKAWALAHNIPTLEASSPTDQAALGPLFATQWDLFVVFAYGLIIPKAILDIPKHGTLNVHPSLLPKLRGASPIRTSLLHNLDGAGVSIMLMDEQMDHGPILAQEKANLHEPIPGCALDELLGKQGAALLVSVIPRWLEGTITPTPQDHSQATFSQKFTKEMAQLALDPYHLPQGEDARDMLLKIYAFDGNPGAFFFHNGKRIKITQAHIEDDTLVITRIIPEGKKEMDFAQYFRDVA